MAEPHNPSKRMRGVIIVLVILTLLSIGNTILFLYLRKDPEIRRALAIYAEQLEEIKAKNGKLPDTLMGPQGPIGITGNKGDKGEPGLTGLKGDKGDTGAMGLTGPHGPIGPAGPQGEQGVQGPQGEPGDPGQNGREIEMRCNPETANMEYRYIGDTEWQPTGGKCVPG